MNKELIIKDPNLPDPLIMLAKSLVQYGNILTNKKTSKYIHHFDDKTGIFWENYVYSMAGDDLAPFITRSSAAWC